MIPHFFAVLYKFATPAAMDILNGLHQGSLRTDCVEIVRETAMKVGFVGLGIMGAPMGRHLQTGDHKFYLHHLVPDLPAELLHDDVVCCRCDHLDGSRYAGRSSRLV